MSDSEKRKNTPSPAYANFDAPEKFQAIQSIIAKRLVEHPNATCSYSGGSDSDIMLHLIENTRRLYNLPPIHYAFFNTGLEMEAIKQHVKDMGKRYDIEIKEYKPKKNIVLATREYGLPFMSKIFSDRLGRVQKKSVPMSIADEFMKADDKQKKRKELGERYPKCQEGINFLCGCLSDGTEKCNQTTIGSAKYLLEFMKENPIPFMVSDKCCEYCKKRPAHLVQKDFDMIITGERKAEGGVRSVSDYGCFGEQKNGKFRLRPLYYVTDKDKAWYKEYYGIRYSDAYEVYGLTRTGCTGCPISSKAIEELEEIRPYEPNLVKAAWNVFGPSYLYRQQYNEYRKKRLAEDKANK